MKTKMLRLIIISTLLTSFAHASTAEEENAKLREAVALAEINLEIIESELAALRAALLELNVQIQKLIATKKAQTAADSESETANTPRWDWTLHAKQTYPNSLLAFGTFTNRSKKTQRFSMKIVIYKKQFLKLPNRTILGSAAYTTGNLKPGESTSVKQLVKVSNPAGPWQIVFSEIRPIPLR